MKYDRDVWQEQVSPSRWSAWMKFVRNNEDYFMMWAVKKGIVTTSEIAYASSKDDYDEWKDYLLTEVFSRTCGIKAIRQHYGWKVSDIKHMPLSCHYDLTTPDGHKYECKFRMNDNDQYPTDRIDEEKKEWVVSASTEGITLLYTLWDGVVRAYDMSKPDNTGEWKKWKRSVSHYGSNTTTDYVTQTFVEWYPQNILWSGTTAMPLIEYEQ